MEGTPAHTLSTTEKLVLFLSSSLVVSDTGPLPVATHTSLVGSYSILELVTISCIAVIFNPYDI